MMLPVVLFDLDGTLVDSSVDLLAAVNDVRAREGLAPVPVTQILGVISQGARAILAQGIPELSDAEREARLADTINIYRGHIGRHGGLFPGITEVLAHIETQGSRWGVVTNKQEELAVIVLEQLGLSERCAVLIGGDTLARAKPDPMPVRVACERLGASPSQAAFIGDDVRDITAGRAAGTRVIAVRWGFHPVDEDPVDWGADTVIDTPLDLLRDGVLTL